MGGGPREVRDGTIVYSDDRSRLDVDVIHGFLVTAYWCKGIPLEVVERAIAGSRCYGVYEDPGGGQAGFARVVTDGATYAYLCDVFVRPPFRGRGLAKGLMEFVLGDPALAGLRRFALMTRDAHGLYARYGFGAMPDPTRYMEINRPGLYEGR